MYFLPTRLSQAELALRDEVRSFVSVEVPEYRRTMLGMSGVGGHDPEFSRRLADRGWLGLTLPSALGGQGGTAVQRFLVTEELLAGQAPVAAHWIADRQSAPMIAARGTDAQRKRFIGPIVAGECWISIGMSEPDSGSDLASVRTTATRVEEGWLLNGTKLWTTFAHKNHWLIVLCRTTESADRHDGLSQFLVDLSSPGVTVRPITTLDGEQDFCEVVLDDVMVPDDLLLGVEGAGWEQVTGELAFERSGPDRYLSAWALFDWLAREAPPGCEEVVGRLSARYRILRELAMSTARSLDAGANPATQAAVTKDLGTLLEQDTVEAVRLWLSPDLDPGSQDRLEQLLSRAVLTSPTFTLRGGSTEMLRSMISRRAGELVTNDDLLVATSNRILADHVSESRDGSFSSGAWNALRKAGITLVGITEELGGSGGEVADASEVLRVVGYSGASVPLAETALMAGWSLAQAGVRVPDVALTVALQHDLRFEGGLLSGLAVSVPYGRHAELVLAVVGGRLLGFSPHQAGVELQEGRSLSGEPRDSIVVAGVRPTMETDFPYATGDLRDRGAATRTLMMAGALRKVLELSASYTSTRRQFGQPINRFQAVGHQVASLAEQVARIEMAAELAKRWLEGTADGDDLAVATLTAREAATTGCRIAHQVHGAIGVAEEYDLQLFTRRLWTWRDECGSERSWAIRLGCSALDAPDLWEWTSRSTGGEPFRPVKYTDH